MNEMLEVLADKYGIDKANEIWHIELFNKLCTNLDFRSQMMEEREIYESNIDDLNSHLVRLCAVENCILEIFKSNASQLFKDRLRASLKKGNIRFDEQDGNPILNLIKS